MRPDRLFPLVLALLLLAGPAAPQLGIGAANRVLVAGDRAAIGVEEGDAADFTVLDLGAEYAVDPGTFLSKGRATPFAGWKVQGRAVLTVVGGKEVYDDNYESNR